MVLARTVYDSAGNILFDMGEELNSDMMSSLTIQGVAEIFIEDPRVDDVPVFPLVEPELEAQLTLAYREIAIASHGETTLDSTLLDSIRIPMMATASGLYPEIPGEVSVAGFHTDEDYRYARRVRVAELSLLMGKVAGYSMYEIIDLGMAALLADIGSIRYPVGYLEKPEPHTPEEAEQIARHPELGAQVLLDTGIQSEEVINAIFSHHERWDGSGFPRGLAKDDIPIFSRIIAIADTFYDMVSTRPDRPPYLPHDVVEFIMAFSGDYFDPEMVRIFARQVPLYPTGVLVRLSTGEEGIISDANLGHIGRPVVRICSDGIGSRTRPHDIDLSQPSQQAKLVTAVLEF